MAFISKRTYKYILLFLLTSILQLLPASLVIDEYNDGLLTPNDLGNWTGGGAGIADNGSELVYTYNDSSWFNTGINQDISTYSYLGLRIRGASGGEESVFQVSLSGGAGTWYTIAAAASDVITTSYRDIYIPLSAFAGADLVNPGNLSFRTEFGAGSGFVYLDRIWLDTDPGCTAAPNEPGSVAVYNKTSGKLEFSWLEPTNHLAVLIYYDTVNIKPSSHQAIVGNGVSNYSLTGLLPGTDYYVWLISSNKCGISTDAAFSDTTLASTGPPDPPTVSFGLVGSETIELTWADNSGDEWGFNVYYSTSPVKPGTPAFTVDADVTSAPVGGLNNNTAFYFWVEGFNGFGPGADDSAATNTVNFAVYKAVNTNTGVYYDSIINAVNAVLNGQTIAALAGSHPLFTVNRDNFTLVSMPYLLTGNNTNTVISGGMAINRTNLTLSGFSITGSASGAIGMNGAQHVNITGNRIYGNVGTGVALWGNCSYIQIISNTGWGSGVGVAGQNNLVWLAGAGTGNYIAYNTGYDFRYEGIGFGGDLVNTVIVGNTFYGTGNGIAMGSGGNPTGTQVFGNNFYNNSGGILMQQGSGAVIRYNNITNNGVGVILSNGISTLELNNICNNTINIASNLVGHLIQNNPCGLPPINPLLIVTNTAQESVISNVHIFRGIASNDIFFPGLGVNVSVYVSMDGGPGQFVGPGDLWSFSVNTTAYSNGPHVWVFSATNDLGNYDIWVQSNIIANPPPLVYVSQGPTMSIVTNSAFDLRLTSSANFGYWSTNGVPFTEFSGTTPDINISSTTVLVFYGSNASTGMGTPVTNIYSINAAAPIVTVTSGPALDLTTNQPFNIELTSSGTNGYWKTNDGPWVQFFPLSGIIPVSNTTVLYFYGENLFGDNSGTNSNSYIFDQSAPIVTVISGPAVDIITNQSFTIQMDVTESYGYWSTNGSSWVQFSGTSPLIDITSSVILSFYGEDLLGNNSGTNSLAYTIALAGIVTRITNLTGLVMGSNGSLYIRDNGIKWLTGLATNDFNVADVPVISFRLDLGAAQVITSNTAFAYAFDPAVAVDGVHTLYALSSSTNPALPAVGSDLTNVIIDRTPPVNAPSGYSGTLRNTVVITLNASDTTAGVHSSLLIISNSDGTAELKRYVIPGGQQSLSLDTLEIPNGLAPALLITLDNAGHAFTNHLILNIYNLTWQPLAGPNPLALSESSVLLVTGLTWESEVSIYTVGGKLVRKFNGADLEAEFSDGIPGRLSWDLLNDSGEPVGSGVYLIFMSDPQGTKQVKVSVIR